jgi:hypothetical protein
MRSADRRRSAKGWSIEGAARKILGLENAVDAICDAENPISQHISGHAIYSVDALRINYAELVPNAYGKEQTASEWVAWPNKETALMAILRWLLFYWSAMT